MSEQYTHGQFADDTNIIVEAKKEYVDATFDIFQCKGKAFGRFVKEEGVKAILISDQPMTYEIKDLSFSWEEEGSLSKLLGFLWGLISWLIR